MDYLIRYAHFLGFMVLFASLVAEHLLTARAMNGRQLRTVARVDAIYGISAALVLITGLLMLTGYGFGKGAHYYLKNGVFHAKFTLFVIVVLLSIRPTMFFRRNRKQPDETTIEVPRAIVMLQRCQLLLVLAIPLLGILIARGVGVRG